MANYDIAISIFLQFLVSLLTAIFTVFSKLYNYFVILCLCLYSNYRESVIRV